MFVPVYRYSGILPGVRITCEREVSDHVDEEESFVKTVKCSLRSLNSSLRERRLEVPQTTVWRTMHAETRADDTCIERNMSDLATGTEPGIAKLPG